MTPLRNVGNYQLNDTRPQLESSRVCFLILCSRPSFPILSKWHCRIAIPTVTAFCASVFLDHPVMGHVRKSNDPKYLNVSADRTKSLNLEECDVRHQTAWHLPNIDFFINVIWLPSDTRHFLYGCLATLVTFSMVVYRHSSLPLWLPSDTRHFLYGCLATLVTFFVVA